MRQLLPALLLFLCFGITGVLQAQSEEESPQLLEADIVEALAAVCPCSIDSEEQEQDDDLSAGECLRKALSPGRVKNFIETLQALGLTDIESANGFSRSLRDERGECRKAANQNGNKNKNKGKKTR
ncbi:MAG: hypothetical protein KDD64_05000 [Bdellovibrionales bacterium]|nr:hypothetical protein [Bdellovibrionales bacterium]